MTFPSTLSTFSNPVATNSLDSPSHSSVEGAQNSTIGQIETVIGQDGGPSASSLGTVIGDLRNPDSGGGGHVQTAVLGGTGQTSFTKGDTFVAQSASVVQKLAVGADGFTLKADASETPGVKWATLPGKITTSLFSSAVAPGAEASVLNVTISGSTLGTSNAIRTRLYWEQERFRDANQSIIGRVQYGGNTIASIFLQNLATTNGSVGGVCEHVIIADNATNSQNNVMLATVPDTSMIGELILDGFNVATSSVESSANQTLGMTMQLSLVTGNTGAIAIKGVTVEKIS